MDQQRNNATYHQTLVKTRATEMAKLICGKDAKLKIAQTPYQMQPFIIESSASEDICRQVVEQIKRSLKKSVCSWMDQLMSQTALSFLVLLGMCIRIKSKNFSFVNI
jgi:hypothetical protein